MAFGPATYVETFDNEVVWVEAPVSPPFGGTENSDRGRPCRYRKVSRAGIPADIKPRKFATS